MLDGVRELLFPVTKEERDEERMVYSRRDELRGKGGGDRTGTTDSGIEQGKRSPEWFDDIEERVEENAERSRENKMYLARMDYRTVWIMRILIGIGAAILGGLMVELFQIPME